MADDLFLNQRDGVLFLIVLQQLWWALCGELFGVEGVEEVGSEADGQAGDGQGDAVAALKKDELDK